jgi:hypothetical protein
MRIPVHGVYGSAFVYGVIWASGGGTNIGGSHGSLLAQPGLLSDSELRLTTAADRNLFAYDVNAR